MEFYAVTVGGYSDYRIVTITMDRELADKIAKKFEKDDARVEVYKDAEVMLKNCYFIEFDESGDVKTSLLVSNAYGYSEVNEPFQSRNGRVAVYIIHDTLEGAIKAAAEKRAMFLAEKNGL